MRCLLFAVYQLKQWAPFRLVSYICIYRILSAIMSIGEPPAVVDLLTPDDEPFGPDDPIAAVLEAEQRVRADQRAAKEAKINMYTERCNTHAARGQPPLHRRTAPTKMERLITSREPCKPTWERNIRTLHDNHMNLGACGDSDEIDGSRGSKAVASSDPPVLSGMEWCWSTHIHIHGRVRTATPRRDCSACISEYVHDDATRPVGLRPNVEPVLPGAEPLSAVVDGPRRMPVAPACQAVGGQ